MASFSAELYVSGYAFPVRRCTYRTTQATDARGRVTAKVLHNAAELLLDVPEVGVLADWANEPHKRLAAVIRFRNTEGIVFESVRLPAAYCVGYHEEFRVGDTTAGAYVCRLHLSDPDGWTWHPGEPNTAFVAPAAGEHGTPPVPATGVKPMGSLALELIKLGLTPAEANYIKLDAHGLVDKTLLHQGASALAPVGGNYKALMGIANSGKTVEIIMSPTFETRTTLKPETMQTMAYENDFDTTWAIMKQDWLQQGRTFEQFKKDNSFLSHKNIWSGMGGVTLVPDEPGGHGKARGENIQVILNTHYTGNTLQEAHRQMAAALAHEMYGHVLFKVQGKRWEHGKQMAPGPGSDYNTPLQNQISQRRDEALRNANHRAH